MSKQKPIAKLASGAMISATLLGTGLAQAGDNPFAMTRLEKGYMVADAGEKMQPGNCGAKMDKGAVSKTSDGNCGAGMGKTATSKAAEGAKMKDGKCGEGKCGGAAKSKM